jgi:hypothetical protein
MTPSEPAAWPELLREPRHGDHFVQVYSDEAFLHDTVCAYVGAALSRGEAVILIATPAHRAAFMERLAEDEVPAEEAAARGQLVLLDAEETLERFSAGGLPDWQGFHELIGGMIAKLRLEHPAVRAYGEMVDVLWQRGERDAAIRLEGFWNDLAGLQTFSLLCAYYLDPLDPAAYHPLECVCKVHTHLIPARDYARFNEAVNQAASEVLERPIADMLLSLAERHRPKTQMPQGQAMLLWLQRNMPRTAEKVLAGVRERCGS